MKFTKEDWIDAKFALEWEENKSSEINKFFKDCNSNNTEVKTRFKYYVATTSIINGSGFYVGRSHTDLPIVKIDELIVNNTKHIIGYKLKAMYANYRQAALKISNTVANWENSEYVNYDISISQKGYLVRLKEAEVLDLWFEPVYQEEYKFKVGDYVHWDGIKPTFGIIETIGEYNYHSLKNTSIEGSYVSCHEKHLKIITREEYKLGYATHKYPKDTKFKSLFTGGKIHLSDGIFIQHPNGYISAGGNYVLLDGNWAEIITTPDITINGYKAEFFSKYVKFGCAEIPMQLFKDLYSTCCVGHPTKLYIQGNKSIESVIIGIGKFSKEQIKEIAEYYIKQL